MASFLDKESQGCFHLGLRPPPLPPGFTLCPPLQQGFSPMTPAICSPLPVEAEGPACSAALPGKQKESKGAEQGVALELSRGKVSKCADPQLGAFVPDEQHLHQEVGPPGIPGGTSRSVAFSVAAPRET